MKPLFHLALAAAALFFFAEPAKAGSLLPCPSRDTSRQHAFTEGILYTRVSFPGNFMNAYLSKIDFEKGTLQEQLNHLQATASSKAYADKAKADMAGMTADERISMGTLMMTAMMSPLHAKIYYSNQRILAKADALSYRMESFMNSSSGNGKIVVMAHDKSKEAAITFSAANLRKVWEKEEVDAEKYEIKPMPEPEKVAGYWCKKVAYTYKEQVGAAKSMFKKPACKLIVWYAPEISKDINFLHPFYFQLDKGILKIEVHYDKSGKNRMLYEVTRIEPAKLTDHNFIVADVQPVIDWDKNEAQAAMSILGVMMSSASKK